MPRTPTPLIGISVGSIKRPDTGAAYLAVRPTYTHAVAVAGGAPMLIPLQLDRDSLRAVYEQMDGIVLSGGGDIDPVRYGAACSPHTASIDEARDEAEILIAQWAVEDDKPLLAICRGHQVLNVALGGTLLQDLRDEAPGSLRHDYSADEWFGRLVHDVTITAGSQLRDVLSEARLAVNSLHHQALAQVADSLRVVGCADDGIIEGIEHPDRRFILGVQWHPEALVDEHPAMKRLFGALTSAARR